MRKHLRAIARGAMKAAGVQHINKKRSSGKSYFAENWRNWL